MTTIVIKDLNESKDMDRQAMRAVTGGSSSPQFSRMFRTNKSMLFQPSQLKLTSQQVDSGIS